MPNLKAKSDGPSGQNGPTKQGKRITPFGITILTGVNYQNRKWEYHLLNKPWTGCLTSQTYLSRLCVYGWSLTCCIKMSTHWALLLSALCIVCQSLTALCVEGYNASESLSLLKCQLFISWLFPPKNCRYAWKTFFASKCSLQWDSIVYICNVTSIHKDYRS